MPHDDPRLRVLFLCTGNSCRSQMAEGFARALRPGVIEAHSAGIRPLALNPLAVRAMAEVGIDISGSVPKRPQDVPGPIDVVVTVCDDAHEACPIVDAARVVHRAFDDPPRLARLETSDERIMPHYRRVRDEIRAFVMQLPTALEHGEARTGERNQQSGNPQPSNRAAAKENPMPTPSRNVHAPNADVGANAPAKSHAAREACSCGPSCCSGPSPEPVPSDGGAASARSDAELDAVRRSVREGYSAIAASGTWNAARSQPQAPDAARQSCCSPGGGCCGPSTFSAEQLAEAIGYSSSDLAATPDGANMGLSCGNPTAIASLRPGETVLDLGSGGGFDCFVAGPKVGPTGRVIGVDMTPDMVSKARSSIALYARQTGLANVEFRLGEIENLPVADASVDVIISNCVLNLSPDKPRVWHEIARVLRPGGRVAVSDLALLRPLPDSVRADVEALIGCVAGAVLVEETRRQAKAAGLVDIMLTPKPQYVEAMTDWQDPLYRRIIASLPPGTKPSDFITSLDVTARRA